MKTYTWIAVMGILFFSCSQPEIKSARSTRESESNIGNTSQINVRHYCAPKSIQSVIIDGENTQSEWDNAQWSDLFVDIEGDLKEKPYLDTKIKMMWDDQFLYVYAEIEEPHVWATLTERDAVVYHDDDFEVFIDPDGDSHKYFEIEVNAHNTLWDLMLMEPYRNGSNDKVLWKWDIPKLKSAVKIRGTLNDPSDKDDGWNVEIAIPMETLTEFSSSLKPAPGVQWRINFSRVDWQMDIMNGVYQKKKNNAGKNLNESNWVWSPQGKINMHMPEMWGILQFVESAEDSFIPDLDLPLKLELRKIYNLLIEEYRDKNHFPHNLDNISITSKDSCSHYYNLESTSHTFWLSKKSCETELTWTIDERGKVFRPSQIKLF